MPLQFLTSQVAHIKGRLHSGNLSEVQYKIEIALDRTPSLILDLDLLDMIDPAGAFMLYIATKKARERNKEIILFCTNNEIVKLIFSALGISYSNIVPDYDYAESEKIPGNVNQNTSHFWHYKSCPLY
jgi:anti-anti-sigma regulatory factor